MAKRMTGGSPEDRIVSKGTLYLSTKRASILRCASKEGQRKRMCGISQIGCMEWRVQRELKTLLKRVLLPNRLRRWLNIIDSSRSWQPTSKRNSVCARTERLSFENSVPSRDFFTRRYPFSVHPIHVFSVRQRTDVFRTRRSLHRPPSS